METENGNGNGNVSQDIYEVTYAGTTRLVMGTEPLIAKLNLCFSLKVSPTNSTLREMTVRLYTPEEVIDVKHNFKYDMNKRGWVVK